MTFIVLFLGLILLAALAVMYGADTRDDFPPYGVTKPRVPRW